MLPWSGFPLIHHCLVGVPTEAIAAEMLWTTPRTLRRPLS
jgi:hypothetical protein